MARGENQGLQIALIIFVIVALMLGVSTFYFFQKYDEERQKAEVARTETQTKTNEVADVSKQRDRLKVIIGHTEQTPLDNVEAEYKKYMDVYAAGIEEGKGKDYRSALANQQIVITQRTEEVDGQKIVVKSLEKTNEEAEKRVAPKLAMANKQQQEEQTKQTQDAKAYQASVKTITDQNTALAAEWTQKQTELQEAVKVARQEQQKATREAAGLKNDVAEAGQVIGKYTSKTATVPDGQVVWVDQRTRMAWINLGREDSLPRQQSFSVHPADTTVMLDEGAGSTRKAGVEVVKVIGAHLAEVKIIDYDLSNPVMAGDKIFTPLWHPGRKQRFAICGITDINGDGSDDRQQLKDLISLSGGVVDQELTASGNKAGPGITYDTTYLIRGAIPKSVDAADEDAGKVAKGMSEMENDARLHGARIITLEHFLDDIGYTNRERIFRQGTGEEYTLKQGIKQQGPKISRGSTSELFRKREPAAGSAYGAKAAPEKKAEKKAEKKEAAEKKEE